MPHANQPSRRSGRADGFTLHLALTSHGYGHMTRSLAVLRELLSLHEGLRAFVSTTIPESRVARELGGKPFTYRSCGYEPGTAQKNCFEVDRPATVAAYRAFAAERSARLDAEVAFLREIRCDAVVADIPALAIRAAAVCGLPAVGVSNFTWDWILEPLLAGSALEDFVRVLREDYAQGTAYLRLPLGSSWSPFPRAEDAPLVGRIARLDPATVRQRLGVGSADRRLALVSPGGWSAEEWSPIRVGDCGRFCFLIVGELPISVASPAVALQLPHELPAGIEFPDLVRASALVITKPGYGIASECLLNRAPMLGIERRDFREAPELVRALRAAGPFAAISLADFFAGRWQAPMRELLSSAAPWQDFPRDGARRIAARLSELFGLGKN